METIIGILVAISIAGIGLLFLLLGYRWAVSDDVTNRLQEFVSDEKKPRRRLIADIYARRLELTGTFRQRIITPFLQRLARSMARLTPVHALEELERKLTIAGHPLGFGAREFYGFRLAILILGGIVALIIFQQDFGGQRKYLIIFGVLVISITVPIVWLRSRMRARQKEIDRSLPDALDMLSVCTTAGLGFDQSMQRVSEYWQTQMGVELARVVTEMEMGLSRKDALRNLAYRTDVPSLSSFVSLIIQAEQLGMSISHTLHAMADQMRIERRFKAEEQARKLPTKILFPLVFFIFPAMLAVIMGPSVPALIDLFNFIGQ